MVVCVDNVIEELQKSDCIIIYGAGILARAAAICLTGTPYFLDIECFMVSAAGGNPLELLGKPVITIDEGTVKFKNPRILIAALEKYQDEILDNLSRHGFHESVSLGFESKLWSRIREKYIQALFERQGKPYRTLNQEIFKDIHIYCVKCHQDREIKSKDKSYPWETPIQVGAALTDERISFVKDNTGEHISNKNREYCELTALYWICKNDTSKYAGLCHYRRYFDINQEILNRICTSDIDVVLTVPVLNFPSVKAMYAHDHIESDWDTMMEAVRILQPEYYKTAVRVQEGVYYYAYNMFIARKEILDSYCTWLFPILEYCEIKCGKKSDKYQNRYIGFLAERLLSIYFIHN